MKSFYPYLLRFVFGAVTVVLISFLPFGLVAAVEEPPDFITIWGSQGSGGGQFYDPYGVAVDTADNVYVADTYNHRIQKFDSEGNFIYLEDDAEVCETDETGKIILTESSFANLIDFIHYSFPDHLTVVQRQLNRTKCR